MSIEDKNSKRFLEMLEDTIDYHRKEYDLTYASAIGCLEIIKDQLMREMYEC